MQPNNKRDQKIGHLAQQVHVGKVQTYHFCSFIIPGYDKFQNIEHTYPTCYSENNYYVPKTSRNFLKFAISSHASSLWNKIVPSYMKDLDSLPLFTSKLKDFLVEDLENEQQYF